MGDLRTTILVTGATGYIGRHLCGWLSAHGYRVRAAVRRESPASLIPGCDEIVVVGDLGSGTDWTEAVNGVDAVAHLAARVHMIHESASDPDQEYDRCNVLGTIKLYEDCRAAGVRRFLYFSTIGVHGEASFAPQARVWTRDDPPSPTTAYARSKWAAESWLREQGRGGTDVTDVTVFRPPLVYGRDAPGNFARLVGVMRRGVPLPFAWVENRRSFVHVNHLVEAAGRCLFAERTAGETYLVSDGQDLPANAFFRALKSALGSRSVLLPCPLPVLRVLAACTGFSDTLRKMIGTLRCDSEPLWRDLGWSPPLAVEEALRQSFRDDPVRASSASHDVTRGRMDE